MLQVLATLQKALAPAPVKVSVNIGEALVKARIADLDPCAWPTSRFVDDLRDEVLSWFWNRVPLHFFPSFKVESLKKVGVSNPFVYVDLSKKAMPAWALAQQPAGADGVFPFPRFLQVLLGICYFICCR